MFAAAVALRGDRAYAWVVTLTGVFGVVAPREAYREFAARFL